MSTPYAVSSDLVSAYPAKSLAIAQYIDGFKTDLAMVQNAQTGVSYTFALTDFTKLVTLNNASAVAVTLPLEATVAWPTGTQLRLMNIGAGTVTVAGAVGVTINGTPLTLAQFKAATLVKTGTNTWTFLPFSSGTAAAVVSSTTGSPTITTDGTATIYKWTGDGTAVIGTGGLVTFWVIGGGGGGAMGGGGAGAACYAQGIVAAGTLTVRVGAGGAAGGSGGTTGYLGLPSALGPFQASGGGGGAVNSGAGVAGGSGGGGGESSGAGGAGISPAGFAGGAGYSGSGADRAMGGGGGGGGVGGAGTVSIGGAGGVGMATTITGSTVSLAGGGGGGRYAGSPGAGVNGGGTGGTSAGGMTAGTINTGGGGGGTGSGGGANGAAGGSGIVYMRVG